MISILLGLSMMDQTRPDKVEKWMPTRWTNDAVEGRAWKEYPRPQLVRSEWMNLNGAWDYAIVAKGTSAWPGSQGEIRVPYPVQSHLSGVQRQVYADQELWYRRSIEVPANWNGKRVRINFGAVDWQCDLYVNGKKVGDHFGGYDPFSFDITDALRTGSNELVLKVWDPTTDGDQPYGKQTFKPGGIWYTAVTGIWQTVWLEPVAKSSIESVIATTKTSGEVTLQIPVRQITGNAQIDARVLLDGAQVARASGKAGSPLTIRVPKPQLWSPDSPTLYDLDVRLVEGNSTLDRVSSYFGIREITLKSDRTGMRTCLNGKPIFMFGPLDQGWWPDGLYTPPTDDALRYDLEVLKRAGFNAVRKHVKVEPARFYRHCDELGLLVWQDMPSNLRYGPGWNTNFREPNLKPDGNRPLESKKRFESEWQRIMDACRAFPSVVVWVPFNEAWGQFDTKRIAEWTKQHDPTRLVNSASGGNFVSTGDIMDIHVYPGPGSPDPEKTRAIVLGEFGGLGMPIEGHTWQAKDNWGYRNFTDTGELMKRYEDLIRNLLLLKSKGLNAAIYTQTTDVEIEVNGLMTYDRALVKMPLDWLRTVNRSVYGPAVTMQPVLKTADEGSQQWKFTTSEPAKNWFENGFVDSNWNDGQGGFGTKITPGAIIGTEWSGKSIWLRKRFNVTDATGDLWLKVHHDEDARVYINGRLVADLDGYTTSYQFVDIPDDVLQSGENVIAVYCRQTDGGQYIDAGIVRAVRSS